MKDLGVELEKLSDIKSKLADFHALRDDLNTALHTYRSETANLTQFQHEFQNLECEKLALVEELRLINEDKNKLETTIKDAEGDRKRSLETARSSYAQLCQLRNELNALAVSLPAEAGLSTLPVELVESDEVQRVILDASVATGQSFASNVEFEQQHRQLPTALYGTSTAAAAAAAVMAAATFASAMDFGRDGGANQRSSAVGPGAGSIEEASEHAGGSAANEFFASSYGRQQPPPMKTCASCLQQIHRNAPICPMCKSKSRSRHPKKPKRPRQDE